MIKRILLWFGALSALFMVPYSFYMGTMFQQFFYKVLPLEIDKSFTGGALQGVYSDPYQDDDGWGGMLYPGHESFVKGTVDILEYRVYEPLRKASWSEEPHSWQLALSTDSIPKESREPIFRIYLDVMEGGRTAPLNPDEEKVLLDPEHPWDFQLDLIPSRGTVLFLNDQGKLLEELPLFVDHSSQSYILRVPLRYGVETLLDGRDSYHQVISGFYDSVSAFAPVKRRSSLRFPGGAPWLNTSSVADYLAPEGVDQYAVLNSENTPVLVALHHLQDNIVAMEDGESPQENDQSEAEYQQYRTGLEEELTQEQLTRLRRGEILFQLDRYEEARHLFEEIWQEEEHPVALIHLATITSLDARDKGAMEAVELVNQSYRLFDKAWPLCSEDSFLRMNLLIHRGNTSISVPQEVFGKAESAGDDFSEAAEIMNSLGEDPPSSIAHLYRRAAEAYGIAGLSQKGRVARLKAESFEKRN